MSFAPKFDRQGRYPVMTSRMPVLFFGVAVFSAILLIAATPAAAMSSKPSNQEAIEKSRRAAHSHAGYAAFGDHVTYTSGEAYSDVEIGNRRPEYGLKYKSLTFHIPVAAAKPGLYRVHLKYAFSKDGVSGRTDGRMRTAALDA
ncbi:MAG: hypothetical protein EA357_00500 [Micavibrio sp.]|nr:MAG: hypothetical protein EA357_00500 [Micavibrio sp.]